LKTIRGSRRQFRHPGKGVVVTAPGHPGKDVSIVLYGQFFAEPDWRKGIDEIHGDLKKDRPPGAPMFPILPG